MRTQLFRILGWWSSFRNDEGDTEFRATAAGNSPLRRWYQPPGLLQPNKRRDAQFRPLSVDCGGETITGETMALAGPGWHY
jgi:hypothetical protein